MESTFFKEFLYLTNFNTILFIAVLIGTFCLIKAMEKKKIKFSTRMILSMGMGLLLGIIVQAVAKFPKDPSTVSWINEVNKWYGLIGYGFINHLIRRMYGVR